MVVIGLGLGSAGYCSCSNIGGALLDAVSGDGARDMVTEIKILPTISHAS